MPLLCRLGAVGCAFYEVIAWSINSTRLGLSPNAAILPLARVAKRDHQFWCIVFDRYPHPTPGSTRSCLAQSGAFSANQGPKAWSEQRLLNALERIEKATVSNTVPVDERRFVAYHSTMTNDEIDNPLQEPDLLTVGELISLQEAAEYAGLTRDSLQGYIYRGRLKAKRLGPIWVTTKAAVDQYLQSRDLESIPKKYRNRP